VFTESRVVIDNTSCKNATVVHVDSANKYGILLEVVQVLTELQLIVKKAYISSDGGWFMDGTMRFLRFFFLKSISSEWLIYPELLIFLCQCSM
jgi:hypothetical protein